MKGIVGVLKQGKIESWIESSVKEIKNEAAGSEWVRKFLRKPRVSMPMWLMEILFADCRLAGSTTIFLWKLPKLLASKCP
jgi:hypothetical protein